MTSFEYNIIAFIAIIVPAIISLSDSKGKRSFLMFLILYGNSFLITLLIFWIAKKILQ